MNKEELLQEALALKRLDRKVRSDKGQSHAYPTTRQAPSVTRKDKGKVRASFTPPSYPALLTYHRLKSRLYSQDQRRQANGELPLLRGFDENGYYIIVPASYETKAKNHDQVVEGRMIHHTSRRVCVQREIDLEYYRFLALQELAMKSPLAEFTEYSEVRSMLMTRYGVDKEVADEAMLKRRINNVDYFCEFYHLTPEDAIMWDYDTWQDMYSYCPAITLPDDFFFSLVAYPGSPEFHPEWAYHADKVIENREIDEQTKRQQRKEQFKNHWRIK